ncbi:hypothetical protein HYPSUDRAFT_537479 [Hypholoma sublateritium FD-334 SS-4]|uniref:DUF6697 domain-containing protein n=1 Tax=Hypholoma sublateritium (strain FD-334 SS-4) TaxID=945553 RepID=A0A0D2LAI8_HYPSF|nr:hypothetical protein HYPSUDRAFT_537479 [Hypholoma sublateritium FD-334 SS-4]
MRQHGPGDESSRTAAPQLPAVVKTSPNTSKSSSAPVASSSTTKTVKSERKPGGSATALTLPLSVAETYLVSSTPLTINPPPLKLEVPRKFLRVAYGGSDQHFLQYIPAETNPSGPGRRCIMFPTLALNPLMPSTPGMHGLVFASRREILNSGTWTVFCKRSNAKPAVWLYVGEYENTLAGTMKAEEFNQQTLLVQREWATQLMDCKLHDCYVSMRARIALRKAGQLPVTGQMGEAKAAEEDRRVNDEIIAVKNNRGLPVNKEDIIEAFCKGEEAIDVIRMRCVAYDHVFAEDMRAKYPNYPALEAASKKKKTPKITAASGKTRKAKGRISRRKTISVASESDEDTTESDEEYAGSGDDFVGPPPSDIRHSTLNRDLRSRLAA